MKKFSASFKLKNATFLSNDSNMDNKKQGIINYIDPSIITYISKVQHEKDRPRKIASIGDLDYKDSNINNGLNDNIHVDTDKKSKARRSLLYLLNVMSGGTFCPEINNYFNELREMKNKEIQDNKDNKEEPKLEKGLTNTSGKDFSIKNPIKRIQTLRDQLLNTPKQNQNPSERFNYHFKKREKDNDMGKIDEKDENLQMKTYTNDFGLKDFENYYSVEEIEKNTQAQFSFTLNKQTQARMKLFKKEEENEKAKKHKKNNFEIKKPNNKKISTVGNGSFNSSNSGKNNNANNTNALTQRKPSSFKKTKQEESKNASSFFHVINRKINEMKGIGEIKEEMYNSSNTSKK